MQELLESITVAELKEWMAYDRISPIGDERGEFQAGLVASTVARVHGNKNVTAGDFMLKDPQPVEMTPEELSKAIARGFGVDLDG